MRSRILFVAAAGLFAASFVSASASTITPGSTVSVDPGTFGGTLEASTGLQTVTAPTFTGTYTEDVYADPNNPLCSGCLAFVIQVQNVSPSGTAPSEIIARQSTSSFAGSTVDVFYEPVDAGRAPESANWDDAGGGVIAFNYVDSPLLAGQSTDYLILDTNATTYTTGFMSLQDGTAGSGPAFAPLAATAVTPEPSSLWLMATGLLGLTGLLRWRIRVRDRELQPQA